MKAEYKCTSCGLEWKTKPGPMECRCGEVYVDWVNYEQWNKWYQKQKKTGKMK